MIHRTLALNLLLFFVLSCASTQNKAPLSDQEEAVRVVGVRPDCVVIRKAPGTWTTEVKVIGSELTVTRTAPMTCKKTVKKSCSSTMTADVVLSEEPCPNPGGPEQLDVEVRLGNWTEKQTFKNLEDGIARLPLPSAYRLAQEQGFPNLQVILDTETPISVSLKESTTYGAEALAAIKTELVSRVEKKEEKVAEECQAIAKNFAQLKKDCSRLGTLAAKVEASKEEAAKVEAAKTEAMNSEVVPTETTQTAPATDVDPALLDEIKKREVAGTGIKELVKMIPRCKKFNRPKMRLPPTVWNIVLPWWWSNADAEGSKKQHELLTVALQQSFKAKPRRMKLENEFVKHCVASGQRLADDANAKQEVKPAAETPQPEATPAAAP